MKANYKVTVILILILVWGVLAWIGSAIYNDHMSDLVVKEELVQAQRQLNGVSSSVEDYLKFLRNTPLTLASEDAVKKQLEHFGSLAEPSRLSQEDRKAQWSRNTELARLNKFLATAASSAEADVIWVMNAAGDCIASSNADKPSSFVGSNYQDREYFSQARDGQPGHQYAIGKVSKKPG